MESTAGCCLPVASIARKILASNKALSAKRLVLQCLCLAALALLPCVAGAAEGDMLWGYHNTAQFVASPAIGEDKTAYALDMGHRLRAISSSGTLKWTLDVEDGGQTTPSLGTDGTIYVPGGSGSLQMWAVSADGQKKWAFSTGGFIDSSAAIGADGTIYFGSGDNYLYAVNPDGTLKWRYLANDCVYKSPAIGADGSLYFTSLATFYALSPDGTLKWKYEGPFDNLGDPAIGADGTIYSGSYFGTLYAFSPAGQIKWTFNLSGNTVASLSIGGDGTIYVPLQGLNIGFVGRVCAVNPDGTHKADYVSGEHISATPAIGEDGVIYALATNSDTLYAFNPDGSVRWSTSCTLGSPVMGYDGTLYVTAGRDLRAFETSSKSPADSPWPMAYANPRNTNRVGTEPMTGDYLCDVQVGYLHVIGLKKDGTLWAWGNNVMGQLGIGTRESSAVPVPIPGLSGVTMISCFPLGAHTLALKNDGTVWAWGNNMFGQVGDGSTTAALQPVQVPGLTNIVQISAGYGHSVALKSDGTVWVWGDIATTLYSGETESPRTPQPVPGISNATAVVAGGEFTLVLREDGTVWSWGTNLSMALGYETEGTKAYTPGRIATLSGIVDIATNGNGGIARDASGHIWQWGDRFDSLLDPEPYLPALKTTIGNVTRMFGGIGNYAVLTGDSRLYVWGTGFKAFLDAHPELGNIPGYGYLNDSPEIAVLDLPELTRNLSLGWFAGIFESVTGTLFFIGTQDEDFPLLGNGTTTHTEYTTPHTMGEVDTFTDRAPAPPPSILPAISVLLLQ